MISLVDTLFKSNKFHCFLFGDGRYRNGIKPGVVERLVVLQSGRVGTAFCAHATTEQKALSSNVHGADARFQKTKVIIYYQYW
jgi:hypothetical protein